MERALLVGGSRFIGPPLVSELQSAGYDVVVLTRGNRDLPPGVDHVEGDRTDRTDLEIARDAADPDLVVDLVAYSPGQVSTALDVFRRCRYVFVSSTHAYERASPVPFREGATPLQPYSSRQAADDSGESYGPRKAEGDRRVFSAASAGFTGADAVSVRPTAVYGPGDYTGRFDYWIDRIRRYDRVAVPGDEFRMPLHLVYVEDAARAIRIVAEEGDAGEAYNVAAREHLTYDDYLSLIGEALSTSVEAVHATGRDLSGVDLSVTDFPLCEPRPYLVSTERLSSLGWESTPHAEAIARTVAAHEAGDGAGAGPDREAEERALDAVLGE